MQYEIKHIHENLGVSMVYVTHDQSEALTMSNRIAVFNDGVIQQLASPEVLYEEPSNAFVAQFIGENNRITGKVSEVRDGTARVTVEDGEVSALAIDCGDVGSDTLLSIRPERVMIAAPDTPNQMSGRVEELIYLGDHIRCRLSIAGNDEFIVKVPNAAGHQHLSVGQTASVSWMTEDCRAFLPH